MSNYDTDLFNGLFGNLFAGLFGSEEDIEFEYRLDGGEIFPLDPSPATIENLSRNTEYLLEIRAVKEGISGDWSSVVFTTKGGILFSRHRRTKTGTFTGNIGP